MSEEQFHPVSQEHYIIVLLGAKFFYYSAHVGAESIMHVIPYLTDPRGGCFAKLSLLEK